MEKLQVTIHDAQTKNMVIRLLHSIEGIEIIDTHRSRKGNPSASLHSLAGIWKDRNISLDELRNKAWKRSNS